MNMDAISRNIIDKSVEKGIDISQVRDCLSMKEENFSKMLLGKKTLTAYSLYRIARSLGCTMDELMEGVGEE